MFVVLRKEIIGVGRALFGASRRIVFGAWNKLQSVNRKIETGFRNERYRNQSRFVNEEASCKVSFGHLVT